MSDDDLQKCLGARIVRADIERGGAVTVNLLLELADGTQGTLQLCSDYEQDWSDLTPGAGLQVDISLKPNQPKLQLDLDMYLEIYSGEAPALCEHAAPQKHLLARHRLEDGWAKSGGQRDNVRASAWVTFAGEGVPAYFRICNSIGCAVQVTLDNETDYVPELVTVGERLVSFTIPHPDNQERAEFSVIDAAYDSGKGFV